MGTVIRIFKQAMQAQCPHGTTTVSGFPVRKTGQHVDDIAPTDGDAIPVVDPFVDEAATDDDPAVVTVLSVVAAAAARRAGRSRKRQGRLTDVGADAVDTDA